MLSPVPQARQPGCPWSAPWLLSLCFSVGSLALTAADQAPITLENEHFRYIISDAGKNLAFIDRATGVDYLRRDVASACAFVRSQGREIAATRVVLEDRQLTLAFGESGLAAHLRVEVRPSHLALAVESVTGNVESLVFLNAPLTLKGKPDEPFGACALSLNLITRVDQLPVLQNSLRAACEKKFGVAGARVAIVGMPMRGMLPALQEVLAGADEMPLCKVAGPWANEIQFNHGSYLFNFGSLTESNAGDWIDMARSLGVTQIDNHGGSAAFFRFGDFALNREKWPQGWETYQRIVTRLHAAGIGSIFHTYAFFIDKHSKYVTPVPDARLDAFRTFTLAEPVSSTSDTIQVNESTAGMNTITGFFEHNSVILHLGNELVTFGGVSQQAPWRFTGLQRGAFGTQAAAHPAGGPVRQLKECFGLLVPNPESSLFEEIAANHAEVVNQAGFDGLYLDAIDGASILRGGDECWYWADKFVFEIQKRLQRPVGMEMSAMWHHFWQYRTRWQAWDYPQRGQQRFIDLHAAEVNGGLLLPLHLGWWNFQTFQPPQVDPTYPEVVEYLGARLIGWNAGISLTGAIDRERLRHVPLLRRAVDILRTCEELRQGGGFDEKTRAQLRQPGQEFTLVRGAGKPFFRHSHSQPHTLSAAEPWTLDWPVANPFAPQPLKIRLEILMSAAAYDDPQAVALTDPAQPVAAGWKTKTAAGVSLAAGEISLAGQPGWELAATNSGQVPQKGAWARLEKQFAPPWNLKDQNALGFWIEGDGQGELLAIRLESPRHLAFGAVADRYLKVDFTGKRYVTLVETESARWSDYNWDDGKGMYNIYRETIHFEAVDAASIWLQNLPPGRSSKCRLGPIKALPMVYGTLPEVVLEINGSAFALPVTMTSGSFLELNGPGDCTIFGPQGERLGAVNPAGEWPVLRHGENQVRFKGHLDVHPAPRAKLTFFFQGEPL